MADMALFMDKLEAIRVAAGEISGQAARLNHDFARFDDLADRTGDEQVRLTARQRAVIESDAGLTAAAAALQALADDAVAALAAPAPRAR
jgi:hypothetical protein